MGRRTRRGVVNRILSTSFQNTPYGMPGNNDWGALSGWYVGMALGLYPDIPGVPGFTVNTARFAEVDLTFEDQHQLVIRASPAPASNGNVSGVAVNGEPWDSTWIALSALQNTQTVNTVDFTLSPQASDWGSTPFSADAPPSFGGQ